MSLSWLGTLGQAPGARPPGCWVGDRGEPIKPWNIGTWKLLNFHYNPSADDESVGSGRRAAALAAQSSQSPFTNEHEGSRLASADGITIGMSTQHHCPLSSGHPSLVRDIWGVVRDVWGDGLYSLPRIRKTYSSRVAELACLVQPWFGFRRLSL